jgi:hypothetical protein
MEQALNSELQNPNLQINWKQAWSNTSFRLQFIVTVLIIISFGFIFPWFFDFLEARDGPQLQDKILNFFPASDISWTIFFFLYTGMVIALFSLIKYPVQLLIAFETYALVTIMRMLSITLFPLNPPEGYIPLHEPFAQLFVTDHRIISKDLFFSGHMATICSLLFALVNKRIKTIVLICVAGVALGVLIQRVHYTIDVLFAPAATFACYYISKRFFTRFNF